MSLVNALQGIVKYCEFATIRWGGAIRRACGGWNVEALDSSSTRRPTVIAITNSRRGATRAPLARPLLMVRAAPLRRATVAWLVAVVMAALGGCGGMPSPKAPAPSALSASVNGWQLEGRCGSYRPSQSPSMRLVLTRLVGTRPETVQADVHLVLH